MDTGVHPDAETHAEHTEGTMLAKVWTCAVVGLDGES